jgi:hypothetical protein
MGGASSVHVTLSVGTVEVPNARLRQYLWCHQARVDAHSVVLPING